LNAARLSIGGEYENQFREMKDAGDDSRFFKSTRLTISQFDELLEVMKARIEPEWRQRGINAEHRLLITLKYNS
jgi:hypothetical protein